MPEARSFPLADDPSTFPTPYQSPSVIFQRRSRPAFQMRSGIAGPIRLISA